mmetsp:Transcript_11623/g.34181  ORF Transcript_11623/g.34181 Transcript_11623/m.34181 type:complete len:210 (+) Transcript_11623:1118-1747(+)
MFPFGGGTYSSAGKHEGRRRSERVLPERQLPHARVDTSLPRLPRRASPQQAHVPEDGPPGVLLRPSRRDGRPRGRPPLPRTVRRRRPSRGSPREQRVQVRVDPRPRPATAQHGGDTAVVRPRSAPPSHRVGEAGGRRGGDARHRRGGGGGRGSADEGADSEHCGRGGGGGRCGCGRERRRGRAPSRGDRRRYGWKERSARELWRIDHVR